MTEPDIVTPPPLTDMRRKVLLNFGLFAIFFIFYIAAAVVQTPEFKTLASLPVMGMPLGLFLSLMIFPLSWVLMIIWFRKAC
ncbi:hypothetical protein JZU69_05830 [bacterium]|nr:hypothetical protein [bacterium]